MIWSDEEEENENDKSKGEEEEEKEEKKEDKKEKEKEKEKEKDKEKEKKSERDDDESESDSRKIRSPKEKIIELLKDKYHSIKNGIKNNTYKVVHENFDELMKNNDKINSIFKKEEIPAYYYECFALIEDITNISKDEQKKLTKENNTSLSSLKKNQVRYLKKIGPAYSEYKKNRKNDEELEKDLENILNNKEKEEKEKRIVILKKIKDQDREFVEKRKKQNTEKLLKLKEFIKKKPTEKNYLYQKENNDYINKENNLIKLENIKRKAFMKHIDLKEFDEMRKNFETIKSQKMKESNERMKIIKESWSQRFKLIPLYVNPLSKLVIEEENKMKQEEQNKILQMKKLKTIQKKYNVPKPQKITIEKIIEKVTQI